VVYTLCLWRSCLFNEPPPTKLYPIITLGEDRSRKSLFIPSLVKINVANRQTPANATGSGSGRSGRATVCVNTSGSQNISRELRICRHPRPAFIRETHARTHSSAPSTTIIGAPAVLHAASVLRSTRCTPSGPPPACQ
jgi:hypothetical protein